VRSMFSCVRSSHDLCARTHTHSLEGTLVVTRPFGWVTMVRISCLFWF